MSFSVNSVVGSGANGATSMSAVLTGCTAGSVIAIVGTSEVGLGSASDDRSNTYSSPSGTGGTAASYYCNNTYTGDVTITIPVGSALPATNAARFLALEIKSTLGTPVLDGHDAIAYQSDPAPNAGRQLTLNTTADTIALASAAANPSNYFAPDSGWTSVLDNVGGYSAYHSLEHAALTGAGAKTVWASTGNWYGTWIGNATLAFKEPSALTKKWKIDVDTDGVTLDALIFSGTTGAKALIDQAQGLTVASGSVKFNVASPGSFSVGDKRFCLLHNWDGSYTTANVSGGAEMAEVIEE